MVEHTPEAPSNCDSGQGPHPSPGTAGIMARLLRTTFGPEVLLGPTRPGGLFSLGGEVRMFRGQYRDPLLVATTGNGGAKQALAARLGRHQVAGLDCATLLVNDLVAQGAEPLFLLDHLTLASPNPDLVVALLEGLSEGCQRAHCALLGGQTVLRSDLLAPGGYALAGFAVGLLEREKILDGEKVLPGDVLLGLHAPGLHAAGAALAQQILLQQAGLDPSSRPGELEAPLGEELLRRATLYAAPIRAVLGNYKRKEIVKSLVHIREEGLSTSLTQALPKGVVARIEKDRWLPPALFRLLREHGALEDSRLYSSFGMGIGMTLVCPAFNANAIRQTLKESGCESSVIGEIESSLDPEAPASVRLE